MKNDIMVSVLCTAYNHEKYIRDALEGFVKQKTNFKFEVIVHDDASTDGTADIILEYQRRYPDIFKVVIQKSNQFQRGRNITVECMLPRAKGKYIAFCEGDDYWIDENKLQMQVDFMEAHTEYGMTMHNAVKLNTVTGEERHLDTFETEGCYSQEQHILAGLGSDFPAFASYVIQADLLKKIPEFFFAGGVIDYPIRMYCANCTKIYYFQEIMSVYRVANDQSYMSMTSKNQTFYNNYTLHMLDFFEKFNLYTNQRFCSLLKKKIDSDYYGFCISIDKKNGLKKAREHSLNMDKVEHCFQKLNENFLDDRVRKIADESGKLFIYGTSRLALLCKKQLEYAGLEFEGFVVSDNQIKDDSIDGKPVFYISELKPDALDIGFVLAIQPVNVEVIENILLSYHFCKYCKPYD